jgi:Xaa-Pro aminopeptidase
MVPPREVRERLARLKKAAGVECVLLFQNADRYYFSGTLMGDFILVEGEGATLHCRKGKERASRETTLPISTRGMRDLSSLDGKSFGIEGDVLPTSYYLYLKTLLPHSSFSDVSPAIRTIRSVKSAYEIKRIERAARIADSGMRHAKEILAPGMREIDLASSVEAHMRQEGHQGLVRSRAFRQELFFGHILSGPSGAVPSFIDSPTGGTGLSAAMPQGAGRRKVRRNEPVLVDYVGAFEGYLADESRVFVCGKLPRPLSDALEAMRAIQEWFRKNLVAGRIAGELFEGSLQLSRTYGAGRYFLGLKEKIKFVGHGVGLELDELPILSSGHSEPLVAGMVTACEPKCIFPAGVVGVEDTFVVGEIRARRLTRFEE